ncbi:MAG: SAM-dependent methyltransferase [Ruminococcaceae bacterium]|nr:SAM-dependent methyltransferase [Oscillospiraceae bacterium]
MTDIKELLLLSFRRDALKKIIFSRPVGSAPEKISARLCAHRGRRILAAELSLPGNTVSQVNLTEDGIGDFFDKYAGEYRQINLLTHLGDAEMKLGKKSAVVLGGDRLLARLSGDTPSFEAAIESLERKKSRMLSGSEDFLIKLGISDKSGRVHDKKQAKFRQICKFLEYVDEIYCELPAKGEICIYDLCCGKSYLSFAVYYYFTAIKNRSIYMLGIDLKRDVIDFCNGMAAELGFSGMQFITDDITNTPKDRTPDMVISLHACDIATDIVLDTAAKLSAKVILSTPCCHRELSTKISAPELAFATKYPKLRRTLSDALTDALRLERLAALGYEVNATELVDPEDTPKNTLLRAIKRKEASAELTEKYSALLSFLMGENADGYIGKL